MGNKVNTPESISPVASDWQNFIVWVDRFQIGKINITFSNMGTTLEPKIQAGSIVEIAGSLYSFSAEEAATGWTAIANSTQAYMALTASGDTVSAEWTTTAPTYRDDLHGWYEAGTNKRYVFASYKDSLGNYTVKVIIKNKYFNDNIYSGNNSVLISGGVYINTNNLYLHPTNVVKTSFPIPAGLTRGVTFDTSTGDLISCDRDTDLIYVHDGISSTILDSFSSASRINLAYNIYNGNLISLSNTTVNEGTIYIHDGISSTILDSFLTPSTSPSGIAYNSITGDLISCDFNTNLIYIHDGISSTILDSFSSPGTGVNGIVYDNCTGDLISFDFNTDLFYVHDGISSTILDSITAPDSNISDIAYNIYNGNLISCDSLTDTIYVNESQIRTY